MSAIKLHLAALAFTLGAFALTFTALGDIAINEVDFSPAEDYMPVSVRK